MDIESVDKASNKSDKKCATSAAVTSTDVDATHRNHSCEIEVIFPTNLQAEQALQILQVDREPTDRVSKSFHLVKKEVDTKDGGNDTICKLKV